MVGIILGSSGESVAAVVEEANATILAFDRQIEGPRSVTGEDYHLRYLGRFPYDPKANTVAGAREAVIPDAVRLEVQGNGTVTFEGHSVSAIHVDDRGLALGSGGGETDRPYVDLGVAASEAVAPIQTLIHRDSFGNWVVEDCGRNGLTRVSYTTLTGERAMPWHQDTISVGR